MYQNLANAVVKQAAQDYFDLLAGFTPPSRDSNIQELEKFFHSEWYRTLTDMNADYLMTRLKEEAAKMALEYTVAKEKGSSQYYVCRVGDEKTPLTCKYTTKKKALHKAAEMQGLEYKLYMKIRRRDGADNHDND